MKNFEQKDEDLLKLFPQNVDSDLLQTYNKEIDEIIALDEMLVKNVDPQLLKSEIQKAYENFIKTDFIPTFADITSNKVKKEETMVKLVAPIDEEFEKIETRVIKIFNK